MKTTRKRYSAEFKAKVALEAIRGDLTLAELGAKHGIHHTMIAAWKRQAVEGMPATFSGALGTWPKPPRRPISTSCMQRSGSLSWSEIYMRAILSSRAQTTSSGLDGTAWRVG